MIASDAHFRVRLARSEADLLGAQRLRYAIFVEELGGDGPLVDHAARLERDALDPYFDHLVLIDSRRDSATLDHVVGVYRLLTEEGAARAGRFYSEDEYDLGPLRASGRRLVELGRSCVLRELRGGQAMLLLWSGLAEYVLARQIEVITITSPRRNCGCGRTRTCSCRWTWWHPKRWTGARRCSRCRR